MLPDRGDPDPGAYSASTINDGVWWNGQVDVGRATVALYCGCLVVLWIDRVRSPARKAAADVRLGDVRLVARPGTRTAVEAPQGIRGRLAPLRGHGIQRDTGQARRMTRWGRRACGRTRPAAARKRGQGKESCGKHDKAGPHGPACHAPCRTRTCNPQIRSLVLYPVELRARSPNLPGPPGASKLGATPGG